MRALQLKVGETVRFANGITATLEKVSPLAAERYLERNHPRNRNCPALRVDRIATDMANDDFLSTHEGIAFDRDEFLVDGQTRLKGVIQSGKTVTMLVFRNLPTRALPVVNTGTSRSVTDAARISGRVADMANHEVATFRAMVTGTSTLRKRRTVTEELNTFEKYRPAVLFASGLMHHMKYRVFYPAPVRAVVARAYYHVPHDTLRRFAEKVVDAVELDRVKDSAVIRLRDYLLKSRGASGSQAILETYQKAQNALHFWVKGDYMERLHANEIDMFPLPENPAKEVA